MPKYILRKARDFYPLPEGGQGDNRLTSSPQCRRFDLATYLYKAIGSSGAISKGRLDATSREVAMAKIKDMGMFPTEVKEESAFTKDITIGNPVNSKDLTIFCNQFEAILKAGVTVLDGLYLLKDQTTKKYFKNVIGDLYAKVEQGEPLSVAMEAHPKTFPEIFRNMIKAGEASGNLEIAFNRMKSHFEKDYKLKQEVQKATMYPIIVGLIAIAVVVVLLVVVVPTFTSMFEQMGAELPVTTKILVAVSGFLATKWYIVIAVILAIVVTIMILNRMEGAVTFFSKLKLSLPVLGNLNKQIITARFARTTSTLLASGLSIIDTVDIVSKVVDNKYISGRLMEAKDQVSKGVPLSEPIKTMGVFPPILTHMVKIGEDTGQLEPILDNIADFFEGEVESAVKQLTTILEPMVIVFLAVVVGFIVISIIQPMFGMYELLGNM